MGYRKGVKVPILDREELRPCIQFFYKSYLLSDLLALDDLILDSTRLPIPAAHHFISWNWFATINGR